MQTSRDGQIVAWLGRVGGAGVGHVRERFGMSRSTAYTRLAVLTADGLLEHRMVLYGWPGMYSATRAGLRWQDLDGLPTFSVRPGGFEHAWRVASVTVALERGLPDGWRVLGEREIKLIELESKDLFASAKVGSIGSQSMLHRPDLAIVSPSGRVVAVEVELSQKGAARLATICRGWGRARHLSHVYYLAAPAPGRAVRRASQTVKATDLLTVLDCSDAVGLVERELDREGVRDVLPA